MKATVTSWKRIPFSEGSPLPYSASFDEQQFERLKQGLVPRQMEDKWFVYYDEPNLYFHRSWTGQPVYRIALVAQGKGARVTESAWSLDLAKAQMADPAYQALLLDFLVSNLLLGQSKSFPRPSGLKEAMPGVFQHHLAGTGYGESVRPMRPWWKFW